MPQKKDISIPKKRCTQKGGGAKPHEETTHRKQSPPPSPRYVFFAPPPYSFSLSKLFRIDRNFPQLTSSETAFGGSRKMVWDGPSARGSAFRYVSPPLVAQSSAIGVTVAATPPFSAIRFRNPKVPRYPSTSPPRHPLLGPCLLQRKVRHLDLGGCSAILARHL